MKKSAVGCWLSAVGAVAAFAAEPGPLLVSDCNRDGVIEDASLAAVGKPCVIIDTDLGSSMDDLFTVDLAARMHREGKLDLMAVMMDRPDLSDQGGNGEFLTFADRYLASLGLGDLPIGKSMEPMESQWVFNPYWTLIYSNSVTGVGLLLPTNRTPEQVASLTNAVTLYRRLLEDAQPKSVVICSTGFLNNLKALMESAPNHGGDDIASTGLELIAAKVKELRIMGGCFDSNSAPVETGGVEYNFAGDPGAAKKVVEEWPTPVVVSPWEVGLKLEYQPDDVLADFPTGTFDPVVRAAYTYWPKPTGEEYMNRLWDPMTVLPLVDGDTLVPLSAKGGIAVDERGVTTFVHDPSSNRCYQVASKMDADAVMNRLREIFQSDDVPLAIGERIVCVTAEDASNTMKRAEFTPSREVENKLGKWSQALETYCDMFEFDVVPTSGGQWAVEAYLKPSDWTNVVESAQAATRQLPIARIAAWRSGEDPISVPLTNCVPGFYYSLFDGAAVTDLKADIRDANCNVLCGTEEPVCLPEVTPPPGGTASGFFLIGVLETPIVIPGETETSTNLHAFPPRGKGDKSDIL